jgi:hypothetical protein
VWSGRDRKGEIRENEEGEEKKELAVVKGLTDDIRGVLQVGERG